MQGREGCRRRCRDRAVRRESNDNDERGGHHSSPRVWSWAPLAVANQGGGEPGRCARRSRTADVLRPGLRGAAPLVVKRSPSIGVATANRRRSAFPGISERRHWALDHVTSWVERRRCADAHHGAAPRRTPPSGSALYPLPQCELRLKEPPSPFSSTVAGLSVSQRSHRGWGTTPLPRLPLSLTA
jgi:hypothetical protein